MEEAADFGVADFDSLDFALADIRGIVEVVLLVDGLEELTLPLGITTGTIYTMIGRKKSDKKWHV